MTKSPTLPPNWAQYIHTHESELVRMANSWDWSTCHRWSEQVFKMIGDGRLPLGWDDPAAIKDLPRDICTSSSRPRPYFHNHQHTQQTTYQYSAAQQAASSPASTPVNPPPSSTVRVDYNKDTDGRPCHQWNWGRDCGFTSSHGDLPARFLHNCAWCAYRFKKLHVQREQDCLKKRGF